MLLFFFFFGPLVFRQGRKEGGGRKKKEFALFLLASNCVFLDFTILPLLHEISLGKVIFFPPPFEIFQNLKTSPFFFFLYTESLYYRIEKKKKNGEEGRWKKRVINFFSSLVVSSRITSRTIVKFLQTHEARRRRRGRRRRGRELGLGQNSLYLFSSSFIPLPQSSFLTSFNVAGRLPTGDVVYGHA